MKEVSNISVFLYAIHMIGIILIFNILKYIYEYLFCYFRFKETVGNFKTNITNEFYKLSCVKKISIILQDLNFNIQIRGINVLSTLSIIFISIILFLVTFIFIYNYIKIISTTLILSSITLFIPYYILKYMKYLRKQKILKIFPNYAINLKSYCQVSNDILEAFRRTDVEQPLNSYIKTFNISVEKGISVYDAFEKLKKNIDIQKINEFITLLEFCYTSGGNFSELLDKFSKIQMNINLKIEQEKQNIFSSKLVLAILVLINIYILFGFIFQSKEYFDILTKTFIGKIILNFNVLSYVIIMFMYMNLNKMEE